MDPLSSETNTIVGQTLCFARRYDEAAAQLKSTLELDQNYAMLAHAYAIAGKRSEAEKLLIQLKDLSTQRHVPPYNIAVVYVGLGDKEQAFAWLERAYADRSFYLTWLKYDPQLDSLRSDLDSPS